MPSTADNFVGEHVFIITNPSKGKFHLYGSDPDEIKIEDIANALSKQCRFTGHLETDAWYSVAEHSIDVQRVIKLLGGTKFEQFCGLMHDTPEAYLSDIAAPFKRELGQYYEKEALIWKRVVPKFGIPEVLPPIVKQADWIALFIEAMTFVVPGREDILTTWVGWDQYGAQALELRHKVKMHGYMYRQARTAFLSKFERFSKYAAG